MNGHATAAPPARATNSRRLLRQFPRLNGTQVSRSGNLAKGLMSALGQNAKYSLRADVFCFASNNRHPSLGSAGPFGARLRSRRSFDHFVGAAQHCRWQIQSECLGSFQVESYWNFVAPHLPQSSVDKSTSFVMLFYVERWRSPGLTKYSPGTEFRFHLRRAGTRCVSPQNWQQTTLEPAWARRAVGEGVKFCQRAGYGKSACPVRAGNDPKLKIADDRDGT